MANDKKSYIGELASSPTNPDYNQFKYHEQNKLSMPLGGVNQKDIDLLDMELYGHNSQLLRMKPGVLSATKTNTDKELGVIQIEDDFKFVESNTFSVTDTREDSSVFNTVFLNYGSYSEKLIDTDGLSLTTTNDTIVYPHIITETSKDNDRKLYGAQVLSKSGSLPTWKVGDASVVVDTSNAVLDSNNNLIHRPKGNTGGTARYGSDAMVYDTRDYSCWYEIGIEVYVSTPNIYEMKIDGRLGTDSVTLSTMPGGRNSGYIYLASDVKIKTDPAWFNFHIKHTSTSTPVDLSLQFIVLNSEPHHNENINYFYYYISDLDMNKHLCEFTIRFKGRWFNGDRSLRDIGTWEFSKGGYNNTQYKVSKRLEANNIYDYTTTKYVLGRPCSNTMLKVDVNQIDFTNNTSSFIVNPNITDVYLVNDLTFSLNDVKLYANILDVNNRISIGLCERKNSERQICIKLINNDKTIFYTALNDYYIAGNLLSVDSISIASSTYYGVKFTVKTNTSSKYYVFGRLSEYDGNKLIDGYDGYYDFVCIDTDTKLEVKPSISVLSSNIKDSRNVRMQCVSYDDNVFFNEDGGFNYNLQLSNIDSGDSFIASFEYGLHSALAVMTDTIKYLIRGLGFYFPFVVSYNRSSSTLSIISLNAISNNGYMVFVKPMILDKDTKTYKQLPVRALDEMPSIVDNIGIGDKSFILGKSKFVSYDGSLYESGGFGLIGNTYKQYLSSKGEIFHSSGYFFLAKDNITQVYTFNELGLQNVFNIEDKIICDPIKLAFGIVAVGTSGIWVVGQSVTKIWSTESSINDAAIKTLVDNSCVIIINYGDGKLKKLVSESSKDILSQSGRFIGKSIPSLLCVNVNQYANVSSQDVESNLQDVILLDAGQSSDLLIMSKIDNEKVSRLIKDTTSSTSTYKFTSNQQVEIYGDPVVGMVNSISFYAIGNGTIKIYVKDMDPIEVAISNARYKRHLVDLNGIPYDEFYYSIECTSGVKLMQKIIGRVNYEDDSYN